MSKNQVVIAYHGGPVPIRKFSPEHGAQGLMWFSEDRKKIERGESGAGSTRYIMTVKLKVKNVAGWREYHDLLLGQIFSKTYGFDAIRLDHGDDGADWALRDPRRVEVIAIEERPAGGWAKAGRAEGRAAKLSLSTLGVHVLPKVEWPVIYVSGKGVKSVLDVGQPVFSTQDAVYEDHVQAMKREIAAGEDIGSVSLVKIQDRFYIFDGHHRLAAYRQMNRPVPAFIYTRGGPDWIAAPKLYRAPGRAMGRLRGLAKPAGGWFVGRAPVVWMDTADLAATESEFASHPAHVARIMRALESGWGREVPPISVILHSGFAHVHNGHHRLLAAVRLGMRSVPVVNFAAMTPSDRAALTRANRAFRQRIGHPLEA